MSTVSQTFWVVRRGHGPEEYEDAAAADDAAGRYAVTDGATESCFAGLWARLLAEGFLRREGSAGGGVRDWGLGIGSANNAETETSNPQSLIPSPQPLTPDPFFPSLAALQEQWCVAVRGRQLSWYSEPAIERGAFATFLGLSVHTDADAVYRWEAMAVGDTCLFHTRGDELLRAFPLERAGQFDNVPKLVGSRMSAQSLRQRRRDWTDGTGGVGDRLWMMTDALAQWCLAENEAGQRPWPKLTLLLTAPEPAERFAAWIERLRDGGRLKNDDVTLLAISLEAP
jgi:hypothetical protein